MLKQWIVFFVRSGNGYSKSGYPVLFTDSPASPLSEQHQTHISYEQWFPGLKLQQLNIEISQIISNKLFPKYMKVMKFGLEVLTGKTFSV